MKILFYPEPDGANQYTSNMVENLEAVSGEALSFSPNIKDIVLRPHKTFRYKKYDVAIISWLENNLRGSGIAMSLFGVMKFFTYIVFFKLAAKKTVYVRHNFYPHDLPEKQTKLAKKIVDVAERLFDKKAAHSGHLINEGYDYIPHPLYQIENKDITPIENDVEKYYLVFGRVERYKKIHTIIEHWPKNEKLLIVGPASDDEYVTELSSKAEGLNIDFDIRFVPNQEVDSIMANAKAIILSHAGDEMIVSGSFFHAISYGVSVIASNQPFLSWLKQDIGFSGLKLYSSINEFGALLNDSNTSPKETVLFESETLFGTQVIQDKLRFMLNDLNR